MKYFLLVLLLISSGFAQTPVPAANVTAVTVGAGWVKSQIREAVRTSSNKVYIFASDDSPCLASSGLGVLRAYVGTGSNATNPKVPTGFTEVDGSHRPVGHTSTTCQFSAGVVALVFSPDVRLSSAGLIHLAYLIPQSTSTGNVIYQTFSTSNTGCGDANGCWGTTTQLATNGSVCGGGSWPRWGNVAMTLDANDHPYVMWATSATCGAAMSNAIQWSANLGSGFTVGSTITGSSGTAELYPALTTASDGTLHAAWQDHSLSTHANIWYAKNTAGTWGSVENVTAGDAAVLAAGDDDQSPSVTIDANGLPHVQFLDGSVQTSYLPADNYFKERYRAVGGAWTDNSPPSDAGGASSAAGTWTGGASNGSGHTGQGYMTSAGKNFYFAGHNSKNSSPAITPGPFVTQNAIGQNWSATTIIDPCNTVSSPSGEAGCDGSMTVRYDPLRDNNPAIIDLLYFKESDGSIGGNHHGTIFYKAIDIGDTGNLFVDGGAGSCTRSASLVAYNAATGCATISAAWTAASAGDTIIAKGCNSAVATCTNGAYSSAFSASGSKASTVTIKAAVGENPWFAGDGSLSSVTNMTVQDERPVNISTEVGIAAGLTMGRMNISGSSANIVWTNIDIWCQQTTPWPHQLTGAIGTSCSVPLVISGVDGFTWNNGSLGPMADCQDATTSPPCSYGTGGRTDISKVTACASNAACNNITFNNILFHDNTNLDGGSAGHVHHEDWKIDQGQNITFKRSRFVRCLGGGGGCDTAVVSMAQSGAAATPDFISFIGNVMEAGEGGGAGFYQTRCANGSPCDAHLTITDNTATATLKTCGSPCNGVTTTWANTIYARNFAFRQNFQGCLAGSYDHNTWFDSSASPTPARCAATGGNGTADNVGLGAPNYATIFVNQPASDYHVLTGSVLANAGGANCSGTDIDGLSRPQGACDVGAYEFTGAAPTTFSISGALSVGGSAANVAYTGTASGNVTADGSGNYLISGLSNGTYTITPTKAATTFTPLNQSGIVVNSANVSGINFTTAASTFTISGTVSPGAGSTAPSPLTVTLSGGASATRSTAAYSFPGLTSGLNYTVTPTAATYTFAPVSSTFNALAANQTANFTATGTATATLQTPAAFSSQGIGITSTPKLPFLVNSGTAALTGISFSIAGTNAGDFSVTPNTCSSGIVNAGFSCQPSVTFTPTATGTRSANLQATDSLGTQSVLLSGTGYQAPVPSCLPAGGSAKSARLVTCTNQVPAATMCWNMASPPTTDGNGTCTAGTTYTGQFMISATGTLFVTGTQAGNTDISANYSFTINPTWTTGWVMNSSTVGATTFGAIANEGIGPPRFLGSTQSTAVITQPTQPTMAAVNSTGYAYSAPGDPYYPVGGHGNCYTALTDSSSGIVDSAHASWSGGGSNVMSDINRAYFALTDGAGSVRYFHAFYDANGCMQRDSTTLPISPSGGTGAGFAFSRNTAATAYKIAPVGKQAQGDPATGTILYQEALSGTTTVTITRTKLFDFNNCPGVDGTLATQGGNGNLNVNYNGQRYSTSLNFVGVPAGQDHAHWVLVWDRPTNSCATYYTGVVQNAENPANGRIWAFCTGPCSQHGSNPAPIDNGSPNSVCDPAGYGVHDTAAWSIGLYVGISGKCAGPTTANNSTTWTSGTTTLQTCNQDLYQCGGHGTSGYQMGWSALNNILHRPANDVTTWTVIRPLLGATVDQHGGDNWFGPAADVNPWLASTERSDISIPCGAVPYCGELLAIKLDGNVVRFGPTFHLWTGAINDLGAIMSMTQDGYCIVFESSWNHTRGFDSDGTTYHKDLFSICNLQ